MKHFAERKNTQIRGFDLKTDKVMVTITYGNLASIKQVGNRTKSCYCNKGLSQNYDKNVSSVARAD